MSEGERADKANRVLRLEELDPGAVRLAIQRYDAKANGSVAVLIAVSFGAFGILRLYDESMKIGFWFASVDNTWRWWLLTAGYGVVGLIGLYFSRLIAYSVMGNRLSNRIFPNNGYWGVFQYSKHDVETATDLDSWIRRRSLWVFKAKWFSEGVVIAAYSVAWLAVAVRWY